MSYRITNIDKWKDLWFSNLSPHAKLLFFYFVENCDNAGFFEVNKKFMLFYTGLNEEQLMDAGTELKKSYIKSQDGTKLWFKNFLKYMVENEFEFAKIESQKFINFFESKGWKVGKNPMKSWKSAVANWIINFYDRNKIQTTKKSKLEVIEQSHAINENIDWNEVYKESTNEQFN